MKTYYVTIENDFDDLRDKGRKTIFDMVYISNAPIPDMNYACTFPTLKEARYYAISIGGGSLDEHTDLYNETDTIVAEYFTGVHYSYEYMHDMVDIHYKKYIHPDMTEEEMDALVDKIADEFPLTDKIALSWAYDIIEATRDSMR